MKKFVKLLIIFYIFCFSFLVFSMTIKGDNQRIKTIKIYDDKNNLIYSEINNRETTLIDYKKIDPLIVQAFIAVEDERFFTHNGFSFSRIAQALLNNTFKKKTKVLQLSHSSFQEFSF